MTHYLGTRRALGIRLAIALPLVLLLISLSFFVPQFPASADDVQSSANPGNTPPTASSVDIDNAATTIHLTENTTTKVTVTATVTDNNGCENISSAQVKLFRTDIGASASDDDNNHYTVSASQDNGSCTPGGSDLSATYTATVAVNYYADPTDPGSVHADTNWTAEVTPSDSAGTGKAATDTIEMSTLTALNTTASVAYGEVSLGTTTAAVDQTVVVTNTGNEGIDVDLDGYGSTDGDGLAMTCTIGSIPIGNERYSATANTDYSAKTPLTDTATKLDLDIPQRTDGASTGNVYWGLAMPAQGVSGTCNGKIVFTANSDPTLD